MAIKYWLDLGCTPRNEAGDEELASLVFLRELRDSSRRQYRLRGVEDETRMVIRERTGGDGPERTFTVAELSERVATLDSLAPHCTGCPASIDGLEFGCISNIAFPISAAAEEWLVQLAPPGTRRRALLEESIRDHGYGAGESLRAWRAVGLLERPEPAEAPGGGPANSEAILHLLFLVGEIAPHHALGVLLRLGGLRTTDGLEGDDVLRAVDGVLSGELDPDTLPELEFALPPRPGEDFSIQEIRRFLYALFVGLSMELPVVVRV